MSMPIVIGGTSDGRLDRVAQLFKAIDDLKAENTRLRELIVRLAPADGMFNEFFQCLFCGRNMANHADNCPWLEARKVLEEEYE